MHPNVQLIPQLTADGSYTFFSQQFGETFHSHHGAKQEAELKFVKPTQLSDKATQSTLFILDICYGLGYNSAAAFQTIWNVNPHCSIQWLGLELDPTVPTTAITYGLLNNWPVAIQQILTLLSNGQILNRPNFHGQLIYGDARQTLQSVIKTNFQADVIFLDPFSPPHCPQLWTVEFIALLAQSLKPEGVLATYSSSAAVRIALLEAGLTITSTPPVGRRAPGTLAYKKILQTSQSTTFRTLNFSQQESEHLLTRAAIPYRDPQLSDRPETIIERRKQEQLTSSLQPASQWRERFFSPKSKSKKVTET